MHMAKTAQEDLTMDQVAGVIYSMIDAYNVIVDGAEPRNRWFLLDEDEQAAAITAVTALRDNPEITPDQNHTNWRRVMEERGWRYGEEIDYDTLRHPNLVPFEELPVPARRISYAMHAATRLLAGPLEEVEQSV
jgi:hypothetical protein